MLRNQRQTTDSLDAKRAEEALMLALRLQQEKGDRVSVQELQRTAEEAGIDPVYLESAIRQVRQDEIMEEEVARTNPSRLISMGAAMAISIFLVLGIRAAPELSESPAFVIALIVAVAIVARTLKQRCRLRGRGRFGGLR